MSPQQGRPRIDCRRRRVSWTKRYAHCPRTTGENLERRYLPVQAVAGYKLEPVRRLDGKLATAKLADPITDHAVL